MLIVIDSTSLKMRILKYIDTYRACLFFIKKTDVVYEKGDVSQFMNGLYVILLRTRPQSERGSEFVYKTKSVETIPLYLSNIASIDG